MKHPVVVHDNLDDRREVWQLLDRISPAKRIAWLDWCCSHCHLPRGKCRPRVTREKTRGETTEIYLDFWSLLLMHKPDEEDMVAKLFLDRLVQLVRHELNSPRKLYVGGYDVGRS